MEIPISKDVQEIILYLIIFIPLAYIAYLSNKIGHLERELETCRQQKAHKEYMERLKRRQERLDRGETITNDDW